MGEKLAVKRTFAVWPTESTALSVNTTVPAVVGTPPKYDVIEPVPGMMEKPAGRVEPGATDQVNGATPPTR